MQREAAADIREFDATCVDVCDVRTGGVPQATMRRGRQRVPRRIIGIRDHARGVGELVQQHGLGVEVCRHGAMIIDVVACEVGEQRGIETQPVQPVLMQRM